MTSVLVDTGAWIALMNRRDPLHGASSEHFGRLRSAGSRLLSTNYITDETATRLRYDAGLPAALLFRESIESARRLGLLRIVWIDPRLEQRAWVLLEAHPEVPLSLTDASSVVVARGHAVKELFTFDADFRALGFRIGPE